MLEGGALCVGQRARAAVLAVPSDEHGLGLRCQLPSLRPDLLAQSETRGPDAVDAARDDDRVVLQAKLAAEVDGDAGEHEVPGVPDIDERPLDPLVAALLEVRCVDRVVDVQVRVDVAPSDLDLLLVRHAWERC